MKSQERHKLKENEFARTVVHAREVLATRQRDVTWAVAVIVALLAIVGGYAWWRQSTASRGTDLLASALAVYEAPVVPVAAPAPGSPAPVQQPGTYRTEQAKLEAALPKFLEAADRYPSTQAGIAARYHAAGILATLGRFSEAEQRFQEVVSKAGSSLYGRTGRLGLAQAQVAQKKYDSAITLYTELSRDTSSQLPVDGVLMELARAYRLAGNTAEARKTLTQVIEQHADSVYATEAKAEIEKLGKA